MGQKRNCYGDIISGIKKLAKPEYGNGKTDKHGQPMVEWGKFLQYADKNGFDKRNVERNGKYKIRIRLPRGTEIIRYAGEMGYYSAPAETQYEELALPYIKETVEYHKYRVNAKYLVLTCVVDKGKVAPGFGSPGGAVQYLHPISIWESVNRHFLVRI